MTVQELKKYFNEFCENNKDCNRICPSDIYTDCFMKFLIENFNITKKEDDK